MKYVVPYVFEATGEGRQERERVAGLWREEGSTKWSNVEIMKVDADEGKKPRLLLWITTNTYPEGVSQYGKPIEPIWVRQAIKSLGELNTRSENV